ncbi:YajQ family cyclic di-GMP-binding protein [Desulfosporosinus sp. PR]|uniref:YajQ family cyclic di-GMP-binding protein n=1 Tax=Candidatus Desulfosporosinus nitrosoreducens TaxID=3401928 RepID=UPI0027F455FB|nr:YajQ family cyclic di-GMP-binding protein [Desulfosporosinus sp. PR]MDQ7096096.1 YajQ family cyclic di-GMP-binding protein [Desulfosporosinus sp. PR]
MAKDSSFDIVSKINLPEVSNAVQQAQKELTQRFDFKNSKSSITLEEEKIVLISDDDFKLRNVVDILESKLVKRGISLRALEYGKPQAAAGDTLRQEVKMVQGIAQDKAKQINKVLKDSKIKVVSSIQGDELRVSGKNKDDLQAAITLLKKEDFGIDLQFINYR